ncbi:MAG: signal peptidase I [Clostridiales Family XIII bacterium]|jgi:signal peptidase I|nr:signal peptidase I [Clostridiales Family XIII bacterium]
MQHEDEIMEKEPGIGRSALLFVRDIAIAFAILILILQFVRPTLIFEHSMENTLHPQDYVFLAKQAYTFGEVEQGDILVFKSVLLDDHGTNKNLIKRVIGLPGDVIEIKDSAVYRNGERLVEPYTKDGVTEGVMAPVTVPEDEYFVMGDNRRVSLDSRREEVGCVPEENLVGKVIFRLFPISTAGVVK